MDATFCRTTHQVPRLHRGDIRRGAASGRSIAETFAAERHQNVAHGASRGTSERNQDEPRSGERRSRTRLAWQSGYSAFTVSQSGAQRVRTYIAQQEEHHRRKTFAEEYIEFLKKHRVAYDPRYVFE